MDAANNSPVSPQWATPYSQQVGNQHSYNATSPSNSDGNHYQSPIISPGNWDSSSPSSPYNQGSPHTSNASPNSTASKEKRASPPSTPPSQAPALPATIGSNKERFFVKSSMDREREKAASRRAQSLMIETVSRKKDRSSRAFGKKDMKDYLVANGTEGFATNSKVKKEPMIMEDLKGSVNDFKCGNDIMQENAAKKHALRLLMRPNATGFSQLV